MNTKLMLVEFGILCLWSLVFAYCTLKNMQISGGIASAYAAFVASAAVKVTFGA